MNSRISTATGRKKAPSVFDAGLPTVSYLDADSSAHAHRLIHDARARAPIAVGPFGPELLSYELVRNALGDSRFRTPLGVDGAGRLHALVSAAITRRGEPVLRTGALVAPDPISMFCTLLGVPRKDWPLFVRWADDPSTRSMDELRWYIDVTVAARCSHLTDDLVSDLIMAEVDGAELDADELRGLVAFLMTAGADEAYQQLSAALAVFGSHPEQWALLAAHPELAAHAAAETMRHSPIRFTVTRIANEDVELDGVLIPAGTLVLLNTAAANRDPEAFDDPDRLDIMRDGPQALLPHDEGLHCLSAHLAQAHLAEALSVLVRSGPGPRPAAHSQSS